MKTPFVSVTLLLTAGSLSALGAEIAGVLPSSAVNFPAFIGSLIASGVLAIAWRDYTRKPSGDAPRTRQTAEPPATVAPAPRAGVPGWVHHALSA